MTHDELRTYAQDCFLKKRFNCSESVLMTMLKHWGVESPIVPRIATGFGGGVGSTREHICGAVSGGIMAIGVALGRDGETESPKAALEATCALMAYMHSKHSDVCCGSILAKHTAPEDSAEKKDLVRAQICGGIVADCCVWISENVEYEQ